jgi:hypothetical protein
LYSILKNFGLSRGIAHHNSAACSQKVGSRGNSPASFTIVPCCSKGVAGCGCYRIATKSSVALANLSVDDVVGISTFSGKNSSVLVVQIPLVSGM